MKKKRRTCALVLVLCFMLTFSLTGTAFAVEEPVVEAAAGSEDEVMEIEAVEVPGETIAIGPDGQAVLDMALADGGAAAELLEQFTDDAAYLSVLDQVLALYYEQGAQDQLAAFTAALGARAQALLADYTQAAAERQSDSLYYVPGEILVVFESEPTSQKAEELAESVGGAVQQSLSLAGAGSVAAVKIAPSQTVAQAVQQYQALPGVAYAQPNYRYIHMAATTQSMPTDPRVADQWHLDKIGVGKAWDMIDRLDDREPVRVGIVDSAVDLNHPDLTNMINKELCADFMTGEKQPYPETPEGDKHGTHVSGIVAAQANNGIGVSGVANGSRNQAVEIISARVIRDDTGGTTLTIVSGIQYCAENGAEVINMSLGAMPGFPQDVDDRLQNDAVDSAVSNDVVVVGAAGNDDSTDYARPSDFESVIGVIATVNYVNSTDNCRAVFSNYGKAKNISAPGENILSTVPGDYDYLSGTSMAAPVVAGVVALVRYANPDLLQDDVKDILYSTTTDLNARGFDTQTAWGNVNAERAVEAAINFKPEPIPPPTPKVPTPRKLIATSVTHNTIELSWEGADEVDEYAIYRSTAKYKSMPEYEKLHTNTREDGTTYTDTGLETGKKYHYIIASRGFDANGEPIPGGFSNRISVVPRCPAPQKLSATGGNKLVTLKWQEVKGADGYYIYRSAKKSGGYKAVKKLTQQAASYRDTGLSANKAYYYKVIPYTNTAGKIVKGATGGPVSARTRRS